MTAFTVRNAMQVDLRGMVQCHLSGFPGRPMTRMGSRWLSHLYSTYLNAEEGVSMVATAANGEVVGIAVGGAPKILRQFRRSASRRLFHLLVVKSITDSVVRRSVISNLAVLLRRRASGRADGPIEGRGSLLSICVLPEHAGSGVANRLLRAFEQEGIGKGFISFQLSVLSVNGRARRFYEKHGWELAPTSHGESVRYLKRVSE